MTSVETAGQGAADVADGGDVPAPRRRSRVTVVSVVALIATVAVGGLLVWSARSGDDGWNGAVEFAPESRGWRPVETSAAEKGAGVVAKGTHPSSGATYSLRQVDGELQASTDLQSVADATERALAGSVARYEPGRHAVQAIVGTRVIRVEYGQAAGPADGAATVVVVVIPSGDTTVYLTIRGDRDRFPDVDALVQEVVAGVGIGD